MRPLGNRAHARHMTCVPAERRRPTLTGDEFGNKQHHSSDKAVDESIRSYERGMQRQRARAARGVRRRNLEPRPPRKKNWEVESHAEWDDTHFDLRERIMPIDERDRRSTIESAASGEGNVPAPEASMPRVAPWTVVSVASGLCVVEREGRWLRCRIRSRLSAQESAYTNVVAVGDRVVVTDDGAGGGIVEEVLLRRTTLLRPEAHDGNRGRRIQVIAANADQVLIVSSWREPFLWHEFIDRCIIAAQRNGLLPIVCVTKADLAEDLAALEHAVAPYPALGIHVIMTSVLTGQGIDELRDLLRGKMTALTGMSGVGKSSLISRVQPGLNLRTSGVSTSSKRLGEGRHTTTMVEMHNLDMGGHVVDTPGVREFGLSGLRRRELASLFPETRELASQCYFANCTHLNEPRCAVAVGVATGAIPQSRYHSYRMILGTLPE